MTSLASLSTAALREVYLATSRAGDDVTADACWAITVSRCPSLDRAADPIVTWNAFPPIPDRGFDWGAHRDSDEGGQSLMGWGRTEAEAILDLIALEAERDEDEAADMQAEWDAEAERAACEAEWRAEYERDEAADAKRDAMRDDPFEAWPDEM